MKLIHNVIPADLPEQVDEIDVARRFSGIARLYGQPALERFRAAHVCVIGVGGVGSWIVEALARSGVGALTLIDFDNVAESNINRQVQAMSATIGQAKIDALAERIAQINPYCNVTLVEEFISPDNLDRLIGTGGLARPAFDYVIDAIDSARDKAALIAHCRQYGIALMTIGGAGGQTDPTKIAVRDLSKTEQEPLLKRVRKLLRTHYGFPRGEKNKFNVDAVFSMEPLQFPAANADSTLDADQSDNTGNIGNIGNTGSAGISGINCAGFGSCVVVTASFGMVAAAHLLRTLADAAPVDRATGSEPALTAGV